MGRDEVMKKIDFIKIIRESDTDPDTSYLGKYGDEFKPGCIVVHDELFYEDVIKDKKYELPEKGREYRFFYPFEIGEKIGSKKYREFSLQNFKRMERLNSGDWGFISVSAEARLLTSYDGKSWLINTISSGGLYGIESDSEESYIKSIEEEELDSLKDVLKECGFSDEEINKAEIKRDE
jgi:hypothetical protein